MRSLFKSKQVFFNLLILSFLISPVFSQQKEDKKAEKEKPKFQKYEEVIPDTAITKKGVFTIHEVDGESKVGGGALPLFVLPSRLLALIPKRLSAHQMERWLRSCDPPVIVRVEKDQVLLDVRNVQERELKSLARAMRALAEA